MHPPTNNQIISIGTSLLTIYRLSSNGRTNIGRPYYWRCDRCSPRPPCTVTLLSSRFSNDTWKENELYRTKHNTIGCIYGCPLRISSKALHINASAYVLEMNNTTNRIEGVGVIRNYANFDQPSWIYNENNYNRYIYAGKYRMDRDELIRYNMDLVDAIEAICFKGKTHLKRGAGLTVDP